MTILLQIYLLILKNVIAIGLVGKQNSKTSPVLVKNEERIKIFKIGKIRILLLQNAVTDEKGVVCKVTAGDIPVIETSFIARAGETVCIVGVRTDGVIECITLKNGEGILNTGKVRGSGIWVTK